jgi:hypothetical protein
VPPRGRRPKCLPHQRSHAPADAQRVPTPLTRPPTNLHGSWKGRRHAQVLPTPPPVSPA